MKNVKNNPLYKPEHPVPVGMEGPGFWYKKGQETELLIPSSRMSSDAAPDLNSTSKIGVERQTALHQVNRSPRPLLYLAEY